MRLKPELKGALLTLFCIALILVGVWIFIGLRRGIWTPIQYERYVWLTENLPVADLLWHGKIKAGDDTEQLIKDRPPHDMTRFGRWIQMYWYPGGPYTNGFSFVGMYALSKDGKLVLASSYSDDGLDERIFFDSLTLANKNEEQAALKTYADKIQSEREEVATTNLNQGFLSETNQNR
jgi:hypothetical protein